jgi:phage shock protein A
MRIQMGALSSTLTFELETLSQHRHLVERLQDEIYAQRSQVEEQRSSLEIMQSRLDQIERNHQQPSTPDNTQGASKNVTSATVNQIPDLNEPRPDSIWEQ